MWRDPLCCFGHPPVMMRDSSTSTNTLMVGVRVVMANCRTRAMLEVTVLDVCGSFLVFPFSKQDLLLQFPVHHSLIGDKSYELPQKVGSDG